MSLHVVERLVAACPSPALLLASGGALRRANAAAARILELPSGSVVDLRAALGVGWRELELAARSGDGDLLAVSRRGTTLRVRPEAVPDERGDLAGVVLFLEPNPRGPAGDESAFRSLFGSDPALLSTKTSAQRFAATELPILLLAETGTGKELLARAIHAESPRSTAPFVPINCGALSAQLLETELFGYAPGAFTGARKDGAEGKIGAARGGTLFLDEVAEMPLALQALLLRVLEDGTYYRVGESRPRHANVRLVAATCRDLPELVRQGGFREDLYYRIAGACLSLPPVRRRRDLTDLIHHLLETTAARLGIATPTLEASALRRLTEQTWPGNVRQLKSALHYALILSNGDPIEAGHLPMELETLAGRAAEPQDMPNPTEGPPATLESLERTRLEQALQRHGGHLSRTARELGIARSTLYRRLRRHGFLS